MKMESKNMVEMIAGIAISVIVFSAILVPAVHAGTIAASAQENYENDSVYFKMAGANDTVTIAFANGTLTLNGEAVTPENNSNVLLSDAFSVDQFLYDGNWLTRVWYQESTELSYPSAFSLTFTDGAVTGSITAGGVTNSFEAAYTYLYYADADGKYTQMSGQATIDAYVNDPNQIILSGLYYTGDNKTTYSYINGELTLEGDYTGSVNITKEKVGLDTWHITGIRVTVGDESFTPFRYIVPTNVIGHTETELSEVIEIIPILITAGLILGILGMIAIRRFE